MFGMHCFYWGVPRIASNVARANQSTDTFPGVFDDEKCHLHKKSTFLRVNLHLQGNLQSMDLVT